MLAGVLALIISKMSQLKSNYLKNYIQLIDFLTSIDIMSILRRCWLKKSANFYSVPARVDCI